MSARVLSLPLLIAPAFFAASFASAETFYVSLKGDDNGPGTRSKPWRTIKHGCSRLKAGDTLVIKSGNYGSERVTFANSGTRKAPILVKAKEPGKVILNDGHFDLTGRHHLVIEGIKFVRHKRGSAISIGDPASYIKVKKCVFLDGVGANGIVIWGHSGGNLALTHHFEFYENQFIDTNEAGDQDYGLSMNYGMYAYVHHNYVFGRHHQAISFKRKFWYGIVEDNVFEGFLYTAHYQGQNLNTGREDNRSRYLIAQRNVFRPAKGYRAKTPIWCANVEHAVIRYNYMEGLESIDGGWGAGIHLSDAEKGYVPGNPAHVLIYGNVMRRIGGTTNNPAIRVLAKCTDVRVFHNTFAYCTRSLGFESRQGLLHLVNNIFFGYKRMIYEGDARNSVFSHNCIVPDWKEKSPTDFSKDPLFVGPFEPMVLKGLNPHFKPDPRADACRIKKGSPCIDAGAFLTRTVGAGSGKEVKVKDAGWFTAGFNQKVPDAEWFSGGFNEPQGSVIRIGNSGPLRVTKVDYENNVITVDKAVKWADGDGVGLYWSGKRPDVGAYEYDEKGSFLIGTSGIETSEH